jgi:agmatinase
MSQQASEEYNPNFLGLPPEFCDQARAAAAVIPVPYDGATTWVKGAKDGPRAILEASLQLELFDIETATEPYRRGIATLPPLLFDGSATALADQVATEVAAVLDRQQLPIVLGGDHSVSIGAIREVARRFAGVSILQLDAHADTRETYANSTHNHACVMARAREWCPIVQVGIRSIDSSEVRQLDRERVFFAHEIRRQPEQGWIERAVDLLSEDVYVTIDLDAFDPSVIPATGTPEPGGLTWYDVTALLGRLVNHRRVVAFDVTELCPAPAHHASAFTAAKLVYRFLAMIFAKETSLLPSQNASEDERSDDTRI